MIPIYISNLIYDACPQFISVQFECDVINSDYNKLLWLEIESLEKYLKVLKQKYNNLKMARTITAASVDVDDAKLKLSKMVREVDKCIGLLRR